MEKADTYFRQAQSHDRRHGFGILPCGRYPEGATALEERITTFKEHLQIVPNVDEICRGLTEEFARAFGARINTLHLSGADSGEIEELKAKYEQRLNPFS